MSSTVIFFIVFFAFGSVSSFTKLSTCDTNFDCGPGQFCYLETGHCSDCYDCGPYNREQTYTKCPQKAHDCGPCLQGFTEEIINGQNGAQWRDRCVPIPVSQEMNVESPGAMAVYVVLFMVLIAFAVFGCVFAMVKRRVVTVRPRDAELGPFLDRPPPPPYEPPSAPACPELFKSCESPTEAPEVQGFHSEPFTETLNKAYPFYPNSHYAREDDDAENFMSLHAQPPEPVPGGNLEVDEEETMASDWTPYRLEETPVEVHGETESAHETRHFAIISAEQESQEITSVGESSTASSDANNNEDEGVPPPHKKRRSSANANASSSSSSAVSVVQSNEINITLQLPMSPFQLN